MKLRIFALAVVLLAAPAVGAAGEEMPDVVMKAVQQEMLRNMARLQTDKLPLPYWMSVTVNDSESVSASAAFGAITGRDQSRGRWLNVELRVGSPELDDTNFSGGWGWSGGASAPTPLDDDPDALRQAQWLETDNLFKTAHETLAKKKAWLEQNTVKDRPADFTMVEPHRHVEPPARLEVDRKKWEAAISELSAMFREFPAIQSSYASFNASASTRRFLTSDGFVTRRGLTRAGISVSANTQAEDGMNLSDQVSFGGRTEQDFPPLDEMKEKVREMAQRLTDRVTAERTEEYLGPVLMEGPAAAGFFNSLLISKLSNPREPLGSGSWGGTVFKNRLNRRVLPDFLSVYDDPYVTEYAGKPLLGAFSVDDDGVPAQKVLLVDKGRLRSWYMSRVPTRKIKDTNGHSRGGSGGPGCVFIESTNAVPEAELLDRLRAVAKDQEMDYGIRIASLSGGGSYLGSPLVMYKVPVDGGPQVPLRGGSFDEITLRTLRDVIVTGNEPHVANVGRASIVCPAILLEEMVIKQPGQETQKLPILRNPYFAK